MTLKGSAGAGGGLWTLSLRTLLVKWSRQESHLAIYNPTTLQDMSSNTHFDRSFIYFYVDIINN